MSLSLSINISDRDALFPSQLPGWTLGKFDLRPSPRRKELTVSLFSLNVIDILAFIKLFYFVIYFIVSEVARVSDFTNPLKLSENKVLFAFVHRVPFSCD